MVQFPLDPLFLSDKFGALNHQDAQMMGMGWKVVRLRVGGPKTFFVEALACLSLYNQPLSDVSLVRHLKALIIQLNLKTKKMERKSLLFKWESLTCCEASIIWMKFPRDVRMCLFDQLAYWKEKCSIKLYLCYGWITQSLSSESLNIFWWGKLSYTLKFLTNNIVPHISLDTRSFLKWFLLNLNKKISYDY